MVDRDPVSGRRECLDAALACVTQDRNASYGEPEDNFKNIADIWNAQGVRIWADSHGAFADDNRPVNATDVALMMVGMKLARLRFNPAHKDSWVDMAGYAACGMECALPATPVAMPAQTVRAEFGAHGIVGWISATNRCADGDMTNDEYHAIHAIGKRPHAAHTFGPELGQWCDGYI